ncbi:MAG: nuclear transport factor 2 family protein [Patescibacteria group bacterium]|nr:nuclear transport factor 2 family protein [Patescibacteria group bacterium]
MLANVELINNFYNYFKTQDTKSYLQLCDDDIEWITMKNVPNGGTYVGKKEVFEEYFPKLLSNFKEFHAMPEEFLDTGEKVVVLGKYHGVGKTGKSFQSPFAHVYTIKNGKIVTFRQYTDTAAIQNVI